MHSPSAWTARSAETWHFSTADCAPDARQDALIDAMRRLRLPFVPRTGPISDARIDVVVSPIGIQLARIESGPLMIAGRSDDEIEGLWLLALLEGQGHFQADGIDAPVRAPMILYGATRHQANLRLEGQCRQLFVRIPHVAIGPRMIAPLDMLTGSLAGETGLERVLHSLLATTAEELDNFGPEALRPFELAMVEMLVAALAANGGTAGRGGAAGARVRHLHRILQTMETMLGDPDLSMVQVAEEVGVSPRYLQRLFAADGKCFGTYLKTRRLERCHGDLVSPLHAQLSISEIAFRWGFNGAAHFSRSFRELYHVSPREHRRAMLGRARSVRS